MAERPKPDLAMNWSRTEEDLVIRLTGGSTCEDGRLLAAALGHGLTAELERRGYDLNTLRFSVRKKKEAAHV